MNNLARVLLVILLLLAQNVAAEEGYYYVHKYRKSEGVGLVLTGLVLTGASIYTQQISEKINGEYKNHTVYDNQYESYWNPETYQWETRITGTTERTVSPSSAEIGSIKRRSNNYMLLTILLRATGIASFTVGVFSFTGMGVTATKEF